MVNSGYPANMLSQDSPSVICSRITVTGILVHFITGFPLHTLGSISILSCNFILLLPSLKIFYHIFMKESEIISDLSELLMVGFRSDDLQGKS